MGWIFRGIIRLLLTGVAFFFIASYVPGLSIESWSVAFLAAFVLGLVNTLIRPIIKLITLPITILTLGLFVFVINTAMVGITAALVPGFEIESVIAALMGSILLSLVSWLINSIVK